MCVGVITPSSIFYRLICSSCSAVSHVMWSWEWPWELCPTLLLCDQGPWHSASQATLLSRCSSVWPKPLSSSHCLLSLALTPSLQITKAQGLFHMTTVWLVKNPNEELNSISVGLSLWFWTSEILHIHSGYFSQLCVTFRHVFFIQGVAKHAQDRAGIPLETFFQVQVCVIYILIQFNSSFP